MVGDLDPVSVEVVVPVHPPQIAGVGALRVGIAHLRGVIERRGVLELGERRQRDSLVAETFHAVGERGLVDNAVGQPELVLEGLPTEFSGRVEHIGGGHA